MPDKEVRWLEGKLPKKNTIFTDYFGTQYLVINNKITFENNERKRFVTLRGLI